MNEKGETHRDECEDDRCTVACMALLVLYMQLRELFYYSSLKIVSVLFVVIFSCFSQLPKLKPQLGGSYCAGPINVL